MTENLPPEIAAPLIAVLTLAAIYQTYIKPGYLKDREKAQTMKHQTHKSTAKGKAETLARKARRAEKYSAH